MATTDRTPVAAYEAPKQSPVHPDRELYSSIANASKELVESFTVPIRAGRAWIVRKGNICRLSTPLGPQVGDLNIWNADDPRERFWSVLTRLLMPYVYNAMNAISCINADCSDICLTIVSNCSNELG